MPFPQLMLTCRQTYWETCLAKLYIHILNFIIFYSIATIKLFFLSCVTEKRIVVKKYKSKGNWYIRKVNTLVKHLLQHLILQEFCVLSRTDFLPLIIIFFFIFYQNSSRLCPRQCPSRSAWTVYVNSNFKVLSQILIKIGLALLKS